MPINFKSLSMMELRSKPGEILDEVASNGQSFVIERNGQQKACLVPISFFLPDISTTRIADELSKLVENNEKFRVTITDDHEIQLIFPNFAQVDNIELAVSLPHGYPNKSPIVTAHPLDENCPHRWQDGSLCIYGAMETWNPGSHDINHVLSLCHRWIENYISWKENKYL